LKIDNEYPAVNHYRCGPIQKIAGRIIWVESAMEKRVSKAIFKSRACELFRQVEMLGETVVVTDRGQPTIEIRPYRNKQENPLELLRASIVHFNMQHSPLPVAAEQEDR
jgi:antitoxin (DNA-binding transcriptional repressor) of toxin-antitoxin stability system